MSEQQGPPLWKTILHASVLVAAAVASDPEMRKNAAYAIRWNYARLQAWLNPPDPLSTVEIAGVIAEAEAALTGKVEEDHS